MSVDVMAAVWKRFPHGGGLRLLALALADHAHDDGTEVRPGIPHLAKKTMQSERQVSRQLKELLAMQWLLPVRAGNGRGVKAAYRVNPEWLRGELLPAPPLKRKGDTTSSFSDESPVVDNSQKGDTTSSFAAKKRMTSATQKDDICDTPYKGNHQEPSPLTPHGGDDGFEKLAAEYPAHRVNRSAALKRWRELQPDDATQAHMAHAARVQSRSGEWLRDEGRAVPNLSKWLLNGGWKRTPPTVTRAAVAAPPVPVAMTPEQLQANAARAREAASFARRVLSKRAVPA
jgi:hypothetical protein